MDCLTTFDYNIHRAVHLKIRRMYHTSSFSWTCPHFQELYYRPGRIFKIDANIRKLDLSILIFTFEQRQEHLNQLTDIVEIRYLGSSANIQGLLFLIFPLPLKLTVVHIRKEK